MGSYTRDQWANKVEFILACLGYAVGLGNVWRFPYLCGRNGGAAFLIPYFIMMTFAGLPVFYMELAIGQYSALSPAFIYQRMAPIAAGLGAAMILAQAYTAIYYNMVLAWALYYFGASFVSPLPWKHCTNEWNTNHCFDALANKTCAKNNTLFYAGGCKVVTPQLQAEIAVNYDTKVIQSPSEEYLNRRVWGLTDNVSDLGLPRWELVLALFGAWVLMYVCLWGGTKTVGKVVYFTATFPYVLLFILLCRGATLPGAIKGVKFFTIPNVTVLKDASVWGDAATQIFFSLSLGAGGLTTIASYNDFHNNLVRDTLIVVFGNCLTSIFAGFVIFPILGHIAHVLDKPVKDIAASGIGLAFAAYPEALARIPIPNLWSVLFFFTLVLLGIDSELVMTETAITAILDARPSWRKPWKKALVVGAVCVAFFAIGLIFTCPGGPYWLTIADNYGGGWPLVILCWIEICMISWLYAVRRFIKDVQMMLGNKDSYEGCCSCCNLTPLRKLFGFPVNWYWLANWAVITPIMLIVVIIFNFIYYERSSLNNYTFPVWADVVGWMITLSCVILVPIGAIVKVIQFHREGKPMRDLFRPTQDWVPGPENHGKVASPKPSQVAPGSYPLATVSSGYKYHDPTPPYPSAPVAHFDANGYPISNDGGAFSSRPTSYINAVNA